MPKFAVVILNRPIQGDKRLVENLWSHGEFLYCNFDN